VVFLTVLGSVLALAAGLMSRTGDVVVDFARGWSRLVLRFAGGRDDVLVRGASCSVADHVSDAVLEAVVLHPPPHFLAVQVRLGAGDGPLDGERGFTGPW